MRQIKQRRRKQQKILRVRLTDRLQFICRWLLSFFVAVFHRSNGEIKCVAINNEMEKNCRRFVRVVGMQMESWRYVLDIGRQTGEGWVLLRICMTALSSLSYSNVLFVLCWVHDYVKWKNDEKLIKCITTRNYCRSLTADDDDVDDDANIHT